MGPGKDDNSASRPKADGSKLKFTSVVFDVFKDIDIEDGIECLVAVQGLHCAADVLIGTNLGQLIKVLAELFDQAGVGLETDPAAVRAPAEKDCVRSDPGADL